ncbi:hypothetical protein KO516_11425 [Citreicella sp. C3M06]|uniref:hypothetical protein n=1 Tax=Citreicella sp. C3M06 TaxID=2841564 RepID=UPI001C08D691|nr:hypothetical protein [Citreicella sp. C3M06]MBU2961420.1 hypothetical protein [Citreicella sp. C3M06]
MAHTVDDARRALAALGFHPAADRLPAIAAILDQNAAAVSVVMNAPLRPACENAPVWRVPVWDQSGKDTA